jgi:hypothetical protein
MDRATLENDSVKPIPSLTSGNISPELLSTSDFRSPAAIHRLHRSSKLRCIIYLHSVRPGYSSTPIPHASMADEFYEPLSDATLPALGLVSIIRGFVLSPPPGVIIAVILTPFLIIISTRLLSGHPSEEASGKDGRTVWMLPYYVPIVGHGFSL